uniref:Uncharacterized protein n=1 Tax=Timema cristinae TaxID=61476 RepID=A0A7R9DCZ5_TIMCR|nr:unnamed protein product [Timema cristinae]
MAGRHTTRQHAQQECPTNKYDSTGMSGSSDYEDVSRFNRRRKRGAQQIEVTSTSSNDSDSYIEKRVKRSRALVSISAMETDLFE